jgi:hypothetical protein
VALTDDEFDQESEQSIFDRMELTPEQAFDLIHPRDPETGQFIPREYDLDPEDLGPF